MQTNAQHFLPSGSYFLLSTGYQKTLHNGGLPLFREISGISGSVDIVSSLYHKKREQTKQSEKFASARMDAGFILE